MPEKKQVENVWKTKTDCFSPSLRTYVGMLSHNTIAHNISSPHVNYYGNHAFSFTHSLVRLSLIA